MEVSFAKYWLSLSHHSQKSTGNAELDFIKFNEDPIRQENTSKSGHMMAVQPELLQSLKSRFSEYRSKNKSSKQQP
jgi:hypothetical protein